MSLNFQATSVSRGGRILLEDITFSVMPGRIFVLCGPNGCGKSTLLSTLSGTLRPESGTVYLDSIPLEKWNAKMLGRRIAFLPQNPPTPTGMDVFTLAACGRYPHTGFLHSLSPGDRDIIRETLASLGLAGMEERKLSTLSGGELRRAWIAMAAVQQADYLILDEPTTGLDIGYQLEILDLIRSLSGDRKIGVLAVLHDLNFAARYADTAALLHDRRLYAVGAPADIFTSENLRTVFGVEAAVTPDPYTDRPHIRPIASAKGEFR